MTGIEEHDHAGDAAGCRDRGRGSRCDGDGSDEADGSQRRGSPDTQAMRYAHGATLALRRLRLEL
jgi:hypothetical protein